MQCDFDAQIVQAANLVKNIRGPTVIRGVGKVKRDDVNVADARAINGYNGLWAVVF